MTYETLLNEAIDRVPGFLARYNKELQDDSLDNESGMHTVFSFVFVPLFTEAIQEQTDTVQDYAAFLEDMEKSHDVHVREVCDFTVLEELCDDLTDDQLKLVLGKEALESSKFIREYIRGPQ